MNSLEIENIQEKILSIFQKKVDDKMEEFFNPYLRKLGIKGKITKGKLKWHGVRMKVEHNIGSVKYQLNQRGVDVSPILEINYQIKYE